jgi:hydrogenase-4 component E
MPADIFLFGILAVTFTMVIAKRITALINGFLWQSFFLFLLMITLAVSQAEARLYIVAFLVLLIKVILIPLFLKLAIKKIKVNQDLGLLINPAVSVFISMFLVYLSYIFAGRFLNSSGSGLNFGLVISLGITLVGIFLMIFRMKALAQIIGLLVMENGIFLAGSVITGGIPFLVEIAVFFDIFVCVIILGVFVYKINRLFTHIDVDKLTELKG